MNNMKKYVYIGIALLIGALSVSLYVAVRERKAVEGKWKIAVENGKAYSTLYSNLQDRNAAFKLTIEQLNYSNDSILKELNKTRKTLKIRDSKLQSLAYISSVFSKTDTILLKDTLFRDHCIKVDTVLSDEWYSVRVALEYPSSVIVKPEFRSVKNIIVSSKRETVNPPKKFFLFRWFQKRHTVISVEVLERNPYVKNQNNRYVEIVR